LQALYSYNAIKDACERINIILPKQYSTEPGSFFIVHKDLILSRPIEFYEKLRAWLLENEKNSIALENMWPIIFNCFVP
jgi:hypothetical protein